MLSVTELGSVSEGWDPNTASSETLFLGTILDHRETPFSEKVKITSQ